METHATDCKFGLILCIRFPPYSTFAIKRDAFYRSASLYMVGHTCNDEKEITATTSKVISLHRTDFADILRTPGNPTVHIFWKPLVVLFEHSPLIPPISNRAAGPRISFRNVVRTLLGLTLQSAGRKGSSIPAKRPSEALKAGRGRRGPGVIYFVGTKSSSLTRTLTNVNSS